MGLARPQPPPEQREVLARQPGRAGYARRGYIRSHGRMEPRLGEPRQLSLVDASTSAWTPPSDAVVIVRSLADPEAFSAIFDRHFVAIHRYLARRVGSTHADDLAAQTFEVAFSRRSSFRSHAESARPWLFGIATNTMRNHKRAERRLFAAITQLCTADAGDSQGDIEQSPSRLDAAAEASRVAATLLRLDHDQRDVLLLHAWADLSYSEIADALSLPIGTVRSRMSRARTKLVAALASPAPEEY
jgi:RNA polymerase sigma factor (sigma-70 family)